MPIYNYLPGTIVNIQDGGLTSQFAPQDDAILVIGTAGQGAVNTPYQVTDRSLSALEFGFSGSLERSIEECVTYSDNVIAFRMGATQMVLSGVGADTTVDAVTPGFSITFTDVTATSPTDYQIWYEDGVLAVWENGELQYSNAADTTVDTSNIALSAAVAGNVGLPLLLVGGPDTPTLAYAVTITAAVALTPTSFRLAPTITTAPVTGLNLTGRQKYIALRQALELLTGITAKVVYCADAQFDQPNVAFYNSSTTIGTGLTAYNPTLLNNPVTNPDALDWLKITQDPYGDNIYQWAGDSVDSTGATVTPYGGLTTTSTTPVTSGITASTLSAPSVLTLTAATSGTLISGSFSFKKGTAGPLVSVALTPASTLAATVTAITAAITAASATGLTAATTGATITVTGTEDSSIAGTNTIVLVSNTLTQPGASVPGFATAADRQGAGFWEVNFGSTLGNFCADLSEIGPLAVCVIGTSGPLSANLVNTRRWVGFLPTYDVNGNPSASGMGLLGIPYLTGCHVENLNSLCADYGTGYRLPGLFVTENETYDGEPQIDNNGNVEDAGRHIHVVADWAFMSNGWAINYVQNIAGLTAGFLSSLDPASGLTNKAINATQIWQPTPVQMDALTEAKIDVLRFKGVNNQPVLLHDLTAATNASDYTNMVRVRCFSLVIQTLLNRANGYIGQSSLDGLTLVAMVTQLDQDLANLTTRGYCNHSSVTVTSTTVQQKIGHATLNLIVHPADELIQLTANVGVGQ
jgi:hypothetical protein